jgi:hypothetical protein
MKIIATILCTLTLTLVGCGGGSEPEPATMIVQLSADTELPAPFMIGPSDIQVVVGPTPVQPPSVVVGPTVSFVTGPVVGPVAIVTTPVISTQPNTPEPNWCTDGFVIGPCVPRCQPNQFTVGPC